MHPQTPLSTHRLPSPYRALLTMLWCAPIGLFIGAIILSRGFTLTLFDPRFTGMLMLMAVPALHIWRQGVDVLSDGLIVRWDWPRFYRYEQLDGWQIFTVNTDRILAVWRHDHQFILRCHATHLSNLPQLTANLRENITHFDNDMQ